MTIRNLFKSLSVLAAVFLVSTASVFGTSADIDKAFESFTDKMTEVLPETTTQLGVWSDAYIGKLFPSAPPHFGVGVTVAGTFINTEEFSSTVETIVNESSKTLPARSRTIRSAAISVTPL